VLTSPDSPEVQRAFAVSRGWNFPAYSTEGTNFIEAMGFTDANGEVMPGVSAFKKKPDGRMTRTGRAEFGPGDEFCAVWHLFELLAEGVNGWEPKFAYSERVASSVRGKEKVG
jgi:predicted dithiol-disulfide oxidoreductase (DUF899 family)